MTDHDEHDVWADEPCDPRPIVIPIAAAVFLAAVLAGLWAKGVV